MAAIFFSAGLHFICFLNEITRIFIYTNWARNYRFYCCTQALPMWADFNTECKKKNHANITVQFFSPIRKSIISYKWRKKNQSNVIFISHLNIYSINFCTPSECAWTAKNFKLNRKKSAGKKTTTTNSHHVLKIPLNFGNFANKK